MTWLTIQVPKTTFRFIFIKDLKTERFRRYEEQNKSKRRQSICRWIAEGGSRKWKRGRHHCPLVTLRANNKNETQWPFLKRPRISGPWEILLYAESDATLRFRLDVYLIVRTNVTPAKSKTIWFRKGKEHAFVVDQTKTNDKTSHVVLFARRPSGAKWNGRNERRKPHAKTTWRFESKNEVDDLVTWVRK